MFSQSRYVVFVMVIAAGIATAETHFIRGDANQDGFFDISDPIYTIYYLYPCLQEPPVLGCLKAADLKDDGTVDLVDVMYGLRYLFISGDNPPKHPYPECREDLTPDDLTCEWYDPCDEGRQKTGGRGF